MQKAGYTTIILVDAEGKESIIFEDKDQKGPTFRMLRLPRLKHDDFMNLMALSENIVGATGDQSFSEAISLGKIPIYECRLHKEAFYGSVLTVCQSNQWTELATYLEMTVSYVDSSKEPRKWDKPLNFEDIYAQFLQLRTFIINNYDYLAKVKSAVSELLISDPRQSSAKTLLLKKINERIEELAPHVKSGNSAFNEIEVLCNIRRSVLSGLSISKSIDSIDQDFCTGKADTLFKQALIIPKFILDFLEQEKEELSAIVISRTGLIAHMQSKS